MPANAAEAWEAKARAWKLSDKDIARPRKLYVLYPWQGKPVLCLGVVMPYYEFVDKSRLTDASWKTRLDSKDRPPIPKWVSPIVSGGNLAKPDLSRRH